MMRSKSLPSLVQQFTGIRTTSRNVLIAAGVCLLCFGLVAAFSTFAGPPTDRALADAVATGG
jgi:hypothetical protein